MWTVYGDAGGSRREPATVVGCFLNSAENWTAFHSDWKALLQAYCVPYLHMKEYAHSVGPFAKWKGNKSLRDKFMGRALDIIEKHGCISFGVLVQSEDFNRAAQKTRFDNLVGNAYLFAARTCLTKINYWCKFHNFHQPVEYIFESGDEKQNWLRAIMKDDGLPEPIFRGKIETDPQRSILPLQAADLLAYELLIGYRQNNTPRQLRYPLQRLQRMQHDWGAWDEAQMLKLLPGSQMARRLEAIVKAAKAAKVGDDGLVSK